LTINKSQFAESMEMPELGGYALPGGLASLARGEITSFVKPIALLGRLPDSTGVSHHVLSIYRALGSAFPIETYETTDQASIESLAWSWPEYSAVVATESILHSPHIVALMRQLRGKLPRILILAWDSDQLDPLEVDVINEAFDVVMPDSESLGEHWAQQVDDHVKWVPFPINLDLRSLAVGPGPRMRQTGSSVIIGAVAAFHPRKQHRLLIDVVADLVDEGENLELIIHSNLAHAGSFEDTIAHARDRLGYRAVITNDDKSPRDLARLYQTLDLFVSLSQGETFNIPVREALSAGVPCVISDIPGHEDLTSLPGVVSVPARIPVLANYPERGDIVAGIQYQCEYAEAKKAVRDLVRQVRVGLGPLPFDVTKSGLTSDVRRRRRRMFSALAEAGAVEFTGLPAPAAPVNREPVARSRKANSPEPRKLVLLGHDAGFFSLFNNYVSHVAWWEGEGKGQFDQVLADWSASAVAFATGNASFESFCYAGGSEGNVFFSLFENPYEDHTYGPETRLDELSNASYLCESFNAKLDPYLTYVHASQLYRSLDFPQWRQRMNAVVRRNLRVRPHIQAEVDLLTSEVPSGCPTMSMHVRHPSHAIEQPDGALADVDDFIRVASDWLGRESSGRILLASDQERVVSRFRSEFADRMLVRDAVARTSEQHDEAFEKLATTAQMTIGHQIQHLKAERPDLWSSKLAEEVVIDALFLATGDILVHSTSNVATAVSMLNPTSSMFHIRGGDTWNSIRARALLEERTQLV
jgi:glycosyltransferase involved in cell wall biosynthesis